MASGVAAAMGEDGITLYFFLVFFVFLAFLAGAFLVFGVMQQLDLHMQGIVSSFFYGSMGRSIT